MSYRQHTYDAVIDKATLDCFYVRLKTRKTKQKTQKLEK